MFGKRRSNKKMKDKIDAANVLFKEIFPALDCARDLEHDLKMAESLQDMADITIAAEDDLLSIDTGIGKYAMTYSEASIIYSVLSILYTKCPIRK